MSSFPDDIWFAICGFVSLQELANLNVCSTSLKGHSDAFIPRRIVAEFETVVGDENVRSLLVPAANLLRILAKPIAFVEKFPYALQEPYPEGSLMNVVKICIYTHFVKRQNTFVRMSKRQSFIASVCLTLYH